MLAAIAYLLFANVALEDGPEGPGVTHAADEGQNIRVGLERHVPMVAGRHCADSGGRGSGWMEGSGVAARGGWRVTGVRCGGE